MLTKNHLHVMIIYVTSKHTKRKETEHMAKKVIQRQVVIGYRHTICKVDKKGKFEPIETVTSERPTFPAKRLNEYREEHNLNDTPIYALPEGKVTELYEMDLDFFMEHARKVEDVVEAVTEGEEQ